MAITESLVKTKLKIRVGAKGVRVESQKEYHEGVPVRDEATRDISINENKKSNMSINVRLPVQGKKRGPDAILDSGEGKRRKMDRGIKQQCGCILKELMSHSYGWAFNIAVDPVAYNIPDYFTIITKPMDLGLIKSKLADNVYLCADEFAADVRLTFANCMLYNPPSNDFHRMAKELNDIFNRRWRSLDAKLRCRGEKDFITNSNGKGSPGKSQPYHEISASLNASLTRKMPREKQNLRKEPKETLKGKTLEKSQRILKKCDLSSRMGGIDVEFNAIDDMSRWEVKRMVKSSWNITAAKVKSATLTDFSRCPESREVTDKGTEGASCSSVNGKAPVTAVDSRCSSCGSLTCQCCLENKRTHASTSDSSGGELSQQRHCGVSSTDYDEKIVDLDSEKAGGAEENVSLSTEFSVCGSSTVSDGGWSPLVDLQLSPKKAMRAAMLRSRFADTIFKAKQKALLDQVDKMDPVKSLQDKERVEKQQREEKAKIEAQILAAEASQMRVEAELKMQREREREAARIALQQMEKTVEIYDNLKFLKDLEMLIQSSVSGFPLVYGLEVEGEIEEGEHVVNPLERLGLYRKDDDLIEDDDVGEEGEILT